MRGVGLTRSCIALTATGLSLVATAAMLPATAIAGPFPGCNATSLAAQDLSGCDLTGITLKGANLSGKNLSGAKFQGDLRGIKLAGANLTDATMLKSQIAGADLTGANLTGLKWSYLGVSGYPPIPLVGIPAALPGETRFVRGYLVGPRMTLYNVDLSGTDLSGANLSGSQFDSSDLSGADLSGANLTGAGLSRSNLDGAKLSDTTMLTGVSAGPIVGTPASLPRQWQLWKGFLFGPGVNLELGDFDVDLSGFDFRGIDLSTFSRWHRVWVDGANVDGCDLARAEGFGLLSSSGQLGVRRAPRIVGVPKSLPPYISLIKGYLVGPKSYLPSALLEDADLSGMVLTDANLAAAVLRGANLTGFDSGGDYVPTDDATSAQVAAKAAGKTREPGARMFRSILTNANVTNAKLRYAGLAGVISGGLRGTPKYLPAGWLLAKGYLIGPKANLTGAKLANAAFKTTNLAATKLTGADLTGAKLKNAKLTGVISSGLIGKPASLPKGWKINASGKLIKS